MPRQIMAALLGAQALTVALTLAPAPAARAEDVVRLAYIDPLSGPLAATGQLGEQHFRFAIDRVNETHAAGPNRRLELAPLDNEVSPNKSLTLLRKAIDDGIHYVAQGNGSSVAFALTDAIAKNNKRAPERSVLFLNYAAVDPSLTNEKCNWYHFRFDADVDMKMRGLTDYLVSQKHIKKVYVFNPDYSFGVSVQKAAEEMLKNRRPDLEVVGVERVPLAKVKDFTPYVQKMQAAGADAVVTGFWGADMLLLAKAANDSGFKGKLYTYYLGSADIIAGVGEGGRGYAQITSWHANVPSEQMEEIAAAFEAKYNQPFYFWNIVEAVDMWAAAMKQADSSDPVKVGKALAGMEWKGPLATVTMRADNHQLLQPLFVSVLEPGVKHTFKNLGMGFKTVGEIPAQQTKLPTTCKFDNAPS